MTALAAHAAMKAMREKGMAADDILDVMEAILTASDCDPVAERRRAFDRERKARKATEAKSSGGIPVETPSQGFQVSPTPPSNLPNPTPSPPIIPPSPESRLIEAGVLAGELADWKAVRAKKRAGPITKTVVDGIEREAAQAGVSVAVAVRTAAERGWQSFRADWVAPQGRATGPPQTRTPTAAEQSRKLREAIERSENEQRERETDRTPYPVLAFVPRVG